MKRSTKDYIWPFIGLAAVAFSAWILFDQLRHISLDDIIDSLYAIPYHNWMWAVLATFSAYIALAGYDWLALQHLHKRLPWGFIGLASFTAYAIGHNLGASVFSGGVVRYRAYKSRGLSAAEVGILVAFCSFTFSLGAIFLGGIVLLLDPAMIRRFFEDLPLWVPIILGIAMLAFVALYAVGSKLNFKTLELRWFKLEYPQANLVLRQLLIGPLELIAAAAIIYFAIPASDNVSFLLVLGIFLASFSMALVSHAPGGLGVLEICFLIGLPEVDPADLIAALLVFRLLYLLIPFALSLLVVLFFERDQWLRRRAEE